jgi:hypothetical protein
MGRERGAEVEGAAGFGEAGEDGGQLGAIEARV